MATASSSFASPCCGNFDLSGQGRRHRTGWSLLYRRLGNRYLRRRTSRTSGSQTAGATFALAAGNTNPQGIADPPAQALGSVRSIAKSPAGSPLFLSATLPAASQASPVLVPLAPPGEQDLVLLATELIRAGKRDNFSLT